MTYHAEKMKALAKIRRYERHIQTLFEQAVNNFHDERKLIEAAMKQRASQFCPPPNNETRNQN